MSTPSKISKSATAAFSNRLLLTCFRGLIGLVIVGCVFASFFIGVNEQETMVGLLGSFCLLIVSLPLFLRRNFSLFEPLTFVILLVLFGTPLKLLYIMLIRFEDAYVALRLLNWEQPEAFLPAMLVVVVGWVCFTIGYEWQVPPSAIRNLYLPQIKDWNGKRLQLVLLLIAIVSLACLIAFVIKAGVNFNSLSEMSSKRFSEEAGSAGERMHDLKYYFYRGAAVSKFLVYLSLLWLLHRRASFVGWMGALFVIALFQTIFLSFILSNRAGVLLVMIDCFVLYYYMRGSINLKLILPAIALAGMLLVPMLATRLNDDSFLSALAQKTLAGRDMLDITKTCHIINHVPGKMDFANGETLWGWIAAPIPSSVWANKPMWSGSGHHILQHVFGDRQGISGIPPGLIAELYWNFGRFGVWFGLFFIGLILRHLFVCFQDFAGRPSSVLIYTMIVTRFGLFSLGGDLGTGIVKTALDLIPLMLVFWFIAIWEKTTLNQPTATTTSHGGVHSDSEQNNSNNRSSTLVNS